MIIELMNKIYNESMTMKRRIQKMLSNSRKKNWTSNNTRRIPVLHAFCTLHLLFYRNICWVYTFFPVKMETFKENALFLIYSSIPYTQNILEAQEVHADFLNFF